MDADAEGVPVSSYPRAARQSRVKCISCNAPVVQTVDDRYVCVECGSAPVEIKEPGDRTADGDATGPTGPDREAG